MILFFIATFKRTILLACLLNIVYHIMYPYLCDFSYLYIIKVVMLIIWIVEIIGFVLDLIYPKVYSQKLISGIKSQIKKPYYYMERMFFYAFAIYVWLPKIYIWPNYIMMAILGLYLGSQIAINSWTYSNRLQKK